MRFSVLLAATAIVLPATSSTAPRVSSGTAADSIVLTVADTGNHARYRVREQLVGFDLPNDAVGTTSAITGSLVFTADGKVSPSSKFTIDLRPLKSDKDRRDGYVQNRILETAQYPTVTLVPTAVEGLHFPLPTTGSVTFTLKGNLTVRGVTKPTSWLGNAKFGAKEINGTTATTFTFATFNMTQPRVPVVLSVADTIKLEYDFSLRRK